MTPEEASHKLAGKAIPLSDKQFEELKNMNSVQPKRTRKPKAKEPLQTVTSSDLILDSEQQPEFPQLLKIMLVVSVLAILILGYVYIYDLGFTKGRQFTVVVNSELDNMESK